MKKIIKSGKVTLEGKNEWEAWIINNSQHSFEEKEGFSRYDYLCELVVTNYELDNTNRS